MRCPPSQLSSTKRISDVWSVTVLSTKLRLANGEMAINGRLICLDGDDSVVVYSLPDLKLLPGYVDLGGRPDWVTFTPDSKQLYIATENTDTVVAIDVAVRKEITRIKVGKSPKRNITWVARGTS